MLPEPVRAELEKIIVSVSPDIYVVDIRYKAGKKGVLSIKIDTDPGISLELCTQVTRKLSVWLEEEDPFDGAYTLEVSSPGVGYPLKLSRQYPQNLGRILKVKLQDGQEFKGKLTNASPDQITLNTQIQSLKGKKKTTKGQKKKAIEADVPPEVVLDINDIQEAKVIID